MEMSRLNKRGSSVHLTCALLLAHLISHSRQLNCLVTATPSENAAATLPLEQAGAKELSGGGNKQPAATSPALEEARDVEDADLLPEFEVTTSSSSTITSTTETSAQAAESTIASTNKATESTSLEPSAGATIDASSTTQASPTEDKQPSSSSTTTTTAEVPECDNLCMNGGRCVVLESGQMVCICPDGFYGIRCQLKNICKITIADNLNGDQVCARIGRTCLLDDKLFRCACDKDEFFVFKADYKQTSSAAAGAASSASGADQSSRANTANQKSGQHKTSTFAYDSLLPLQMATSSSLFETPNAGDNNNVNGQQTARKSTGEKRHHAQANRQTYLAECRKIDKCLGVRCRQTSEVCQEGLCVCNQNLGYIQDPADGLCKLLDPCQMATRDQLPICGQAKCVATYDRELYKCVCPLGYNPIKVGEHRSSIQCALLTNLLCEIPLLNNCQHLCKVDRKTNTYKCSCLPGYKPGTRPGIDDNMCFFDEHLNDSPVNSQQQDSNQRLANGRILDQLKKAESEQRTPRAADDLIAYDPSPTNRAGSSGEQKVRFRIVEQQRSPHQEEDLKKAPQWRDITIKREIVHATGPMGTAAGATGTAKGVDPQQGAYGHGASQMPDSGGPPGAGHPRSSYQLSEEDDMYDYDHYAGGDLGSMSAQDRCNMYCEENKICVLEENSRDSYRCQCDRQGYVSVGDKCLDWCSAAEFSHGVQSFLAEVCYSGICNQLDQRPRRPPPLASNHFHGRPQVQASGELERERLKAASESSWRPAFECDCTSSPLMFKDPETHLCKLDFDAILRPCLPGNEGHTDCVVNKHSYCAVLHRHTQLFFRDLFSEQIFENQLKTPGSTQANSSAASSKQDQQKSSVPPGGKKLRPKEKLYTCVCSPEKKFLVDKPRNKARCIDECDLLNNECGRFNRMCRAATIDSNRDFGFNWNLIRFDRDGVRMNQFKRTGCECLPGFNVGPTEARDFTLDDNYPEPGGQIGAAGLASAATVWPSPEALALSEQSAQRWQVMDAYEMFQEFPGASSGDIGGLLSGADFSAPEFEHLRTKYININSRCLLDFDVVEFHASFKAPADFEPAWIKVRNTRPLVTSPISTTPLPVAATKPATTDESNQQEAASSLAKKQASKIEETSGEQEAKEALKLARGRREFVEGNNAQASRASMLKIPAFMRADIAEFHKHAVLVAQCDYSLAQLSFEAYAKCLRYRYWVVQKLRHHFVDWRRVMSRNLKETFDLMDGNIRFRVNKCEATIKRIATIPAAYEESLDTGSGSGGSGSGGNDEQLSSSSTTNDATLLTMSGRDGSANIAQVHDHPQPIERIATEFDPLDHYAKIDADIDCELTIHSASDDSGSRRHARKVLLEKQLPKFIFSEHELALDESFTKLFHPDAAAADSPSKPPPGGDPDYYLLAPNTLIQRESFDQLARHRKLFSPCKSDYAYCDRQTRCEMVDTVNYSCTCEYGYTPIGSRDIYFGDSRKEVCEDINECLFDVCKENGLENKSVCVNEIGDYKCQCTRHHVGDNKRYCNHICNVIACKYGDCRIPDEHHAFCECHEGYREADCSVLDPSVALRKANMIICGSIFASVLLLAITLAISLNSQLKKTKKKLKRLEAAQDAAEFLEFNLQQAPFSRQRVSKASIGS